MPDTPSKLQWNVLSLGAQPGGILVILAAWFLLFKGFGFFGMFFVIYAYVGFSVLGVLFAVISLAKREKHLLITLGGLLLNCAALLFLWIHRNTQIYGPGP